MFRLYVIGIGYKPFTSEIKEIISFSDAILTSIRLNDILKSYKEYEEIKDKVKCINNVDETISFIKTMASKQKKVVLLASGDPLFFGIGRRAVSEFGKGAVEIIPDISSIQLAFAKIKEPWDDAFLMSLHGGPDPTRRRSMPYNISDIPGLLKIHKKIAILTDSVNNPLKIASVINSSGSQSLCKMFVCEKLGYPDEKITEGTPYEIVNFSFSEPNLVILLSQQYFAPNVSQPTTPYGSKYLKKESPLLGLSEEEIIHTGGLITKDEIRAVTLHKLKLIPSEVFWDIGAGSGSVSIEVSKLCPEIKIYTIEKDPAQATNILSNKKKFNLENIHLIIGEAPEVLKGLPRPKRVFIGGSGGRLEDIIAFVTTTNVEVIVINASTIETFNKAFKALHKSDYDVEAVQVNISRIKRIRDGNYLSALNPVFIVRGRRTVI